MNAANMACLFSSASPSHTFYTATGLPIVAMPPDRPETPAEIGFFLFRNHPDLKHTRCKEADHQQQYRSYNGHRDVVTSTAAKYIYVAIDGDFLTVGFKL